MSGENMGPADVAQDKQQRNDREAWSAPTLTRLGSEETDGVGAFCEDGPCNFNGSSCE